MIRAPSRGRAASVGSDAAEDDPRRRRMRESLNLIPAQAVLVWLATAPLLAPAVSRAQLAQYTPPGTTRDRPGDERERLELRLEEALWKLGALRLDPWIGLTNVAAISNSFGTSTGQQQQNDVTMTAGAGIEGIVPFGADAFLTFDAIPQYVVWLDQEDRNQFNQWFGARLHGFFNHLYLETGVSRRDAVQVRSSEADIDVDTRYDVADLVAELRLAETIQLFGAVSLGEISSLEDPTADPLPDYSTQDRDETVLRGGVRYKPLESSWVGIGVERYEADFLDPLADRSNAGTSPLVQLQHEAPRFFVIGEAVFRDLSPDGEASTFVPFDGITGNLQLTFEPGWRMGYTPYYRRNLFYALEEGYPYFESSRWGLSVRAELSQRWQAIAYAEAGLDDYEPEQPGIAARDDDFGSIGIDFGVRVSRLLELRFGYSFDEWDSNLDGFDRDNDRFRLQLNTGLALGGR
jgi:hypothetical protein